MKFYSTLSIFGVNLHRKNKSVGISVISWKSVFREKLFWRRKKTIVESTFWCYWHFIPTSWQRVLSQIEKLKTIKNESDFRPICWNSSKFESRFLQRVRIWYNHSITRQFLNGNFHVSEFETKNFSQTKFIGERTYFLSKLPRKKSDFETNFQNASECQSRLSKRVRF